MYPKFLLVLPLFFLLAGCPPFSKNPLSSPQTSIADPRLAGNWTNDILRITPGKGAWMHGVGHEVGGSKSDETVYDFFPTIIGGEHFLNVQVTSRDKMNIHTRMKEYYFVRYEISNSGILTLWVIPEPTARKIIRSGKLKGYVDNDGAVFIEDSTENIVKFLENSNIRSLFSQKQGAYKRLP